MDWEHSDEIGKVMSGVPGSLVGHALTSVSAASNACHVLPTDDKGPA